MLGLALGCIGMCFHDFVACTPGEFSYICDAYTRSRDNAEREAWERTRMLATIVVQPHTRTPLSPQRLIPLPWDTEPHKKESRDTPPLSMAERRARAQKRLKTVKP